jgi:hypothetical protein
VTPELFGQALTVLFVTCRALLAWIAVAAVCATGLLLAVAAGTAKAWRAVRSRHRWPSRARKGLRARFHIRQPQRAAGGRTANPHYEEAA